MGEELKETRKEIEKKGAKWRAEETSVSNLPTEERRKRLGLNPTDEELEALKKKGSGCKKGGK